MSYAKSMRFKKKIEASGMKKILLAAPVCGLLMFNLACQPNASILNSKTADEAPVNAAPNVSPFESDLRSMQTANFDFIYVFRRKDGGPLDAEDRRFAKTNSPAETNRFVLSDEDRAIIAGSKYKFTPENLKALGARFSVADFSKPEAAADANSALQTNVNR